MRRKKDSMESLNIGGSSILVIFVLLCLVTFATLTLTTALSSYNLSLRVAEASDEYFAADSRAEIVLSEISSLLQSAGADVNIIENGLTDIGYNAVFDRTSAGMGIISYYIPISLTRQLNVRLEADYINQEIRVIMWRVSNLPHHAEPVGIPVLH